jgi:hypothetical protein
MVRVVPRGLELLLERKLVRRFLRDSGWAIVGRDPIRTAAQPSPYPGPERRRYAF